MTAAGEVYDPRDAWDTMHAPGRANLFWTTDNAGEAGPGVQTPLSGRLWAEMGDTMMRTVAHAMGVVSAAERVDLPTGPDRATCLFFGRLALQVDYMAMIGDRVPGTSGEQAVLGLFSHVPEGMTFAPTRHRYPFIAAKLPVAAVRSCREVRRLAAPTDAWWRAQVPRFDALGLPEAIALFAEGRRRYEHSITGHSLARLSAMLPTLEALT
jgi:pyruvate,water dikinase